MTDGKSSDGLFKDVANLYITSTLAKPRQLEPDVLFFFFLIHKGSCYLFELTTSH